MGESRAEVGANAVGVIFPPLGDAKKLTNELDTSNTTHGFVYCQYAPQEHAKRPK